MNTKPYLTDVSVLMLFHARPDHFSKVWEEVRKARPARLFLYQDGPREGKNDMPGIMECRSLVSDENIDWQCEVHRNYQERNYGCDPSGFMSQRWAFSLTDKCIVLEDDVVPSQSFFPFCKEMLDRYEHDERITMIAGFNTEAPPQLSPKREGVQTLSMGKAHDAKLSLSPLGEGRGGAPSPSYFFTRAFSIWGWASWARVVNNWDGDYGFVKDKALLEDLRAKAIKHKQRRDMVPMCLSHASQGKQFFETIFWAYMTMHEGLAIMPAQNLINNIGLDGGTHYSTQLNLIPKRLRKQFTMPRHELQFPLVHPAEVKENPEYQRLFYLRNAWDNPCRKVQYSLEELWLNLLRGNFRNIFNAIINRINKTINK